MQTAEPEKRTPAVTRPSRAELLSDIVHNLTCMSDDGLWLTQILAEMLTVEGSLTSDDDQLAGALNVMSADRATRAAARRGRKGAANG